MRAAGDERREAARRGLEAERRLREALKRGGAEIMARLTAQLENEIGRLESLLAFTPEQDERVMLKAEIAHLRAILEHKRSRSRRKPPEAGLPVPAIPPHGPQPKQGGAAEPLDFER